MNCLPCGNENPENSRFCSRCGTSLSSSSVRDIGAVPANSIRYHGLDALRGVAMLLGIVLHAALPYIPNVQVFWPADERSSHVISTIFQFIHIWRMPLFFILAGFFANLVIDRKSWRYWWGNRILRIGLPILVFYPLMSLTLPWIFKFGRTGDIIFFYSNEGQPFHLWFLWHLMIFALFTAIWRPFYLLSASISNGLKRIGWELIDGSLHKSKSILSGILFQSRFPLALIIVCSIINFPTRGELIGNPIASGLFFAFGYSLYKNTRLFAFLKANWVFYFLLAMVIFSLYMIVTVEVSHNLVKGIYGNDTAALDEEAMELLKLSQYLSRIICSVLFSYSFIGLAEKQFGSYYPKLRFVSDGSYWMYLIHLPVVAFITFLMFNIHIPIEIKFLIAIVATFIICLGTYKYFVRSTFIGILLNGKTHS